VTTQHSNIRLRQFVPEDYEAVVAFWHSIEHGLGLGMSDTREEIAKKYQRDPDLFVLAEDDGRIVGTVIGGFDGRRGMIYHLAAAHAYRGQGLGKRLMAEVETLLKAKGCRKCYLLVRKDNHDVVSFYEQLGWSDMSQNVTMMGKELQ